MKVGWPCLRVAASPLTPLPTPSPMEGVADQTMAEAVVATVVTMEPTEATGAMAVAKVVAVSARTEEQTADPSVNLHKNPAVNFGGNPVVYHDFMQQTRAEHNADSGVVADLDSSDPGDDSPSSYAPASTGGTVSASGGGEPSATSHASSRGPARRGLEVHSSPDGPRASHAPLSSRQVAWSPLGGRADQPGTSRAGSKIRLAPRVGQSGAQHDVTASPLDPVHLHRLLLRLHRAWMDLLWRRTLQLFLHPHREQGHNMVQMVRSGMIRYDLLVLLL